MKKILKRIGLLGICAFTISGCSYKDVLNKITGIFKGQEPSQSEEQKPEPSKPDPENPEPEKPDPVHVHTYSALIPEQAPTCIEDGMRAHYECAECGKYFDEEKNEVSLESLTIQKLGHLSGSAWYEEGGYHYHICERCSAKVDVALHTLHEVSAIEADHDHDGSFMHYECDICNKKFLDSHGLVQIVHYSTSATGHDNELTYHPEVAAACENEGTKAYYSCSCGALFEDAEGTKPIANPAKTPALGHIHNGVWKSDGTKHWHTCFRCNAILDEHEHTAGSELYQDLTHSWRLCTECNHKVDIQELVISGCHHERLMHFDKVEPTFTKPGHVEYYYCLDCQKSFYDAACTQEIENAVYGISDKRDGRYLSPLTTVFNILNQNLRDYLDAETDPEVIAALRNNSVHNYQAKKMIMWEDTFKAPYTIEVSNSRMFDTFKSYTSTMNAYTFDGTLTPGMTYYYRVKDTSNKYIVDDFSFKVDDSYSLRTLTIDGVSNVRDLGGWTAKDGNKVAYGKLYRGGEIKVITEKGKQQYLNDLGIKTEIDLRGDNPQQVIYDSGLSYRNLPVWMYTSIIPGISITYPNGPTFNFKEYSIASIKSIFETLADESSYPVYYHCSAGADRTGTISYLISGLLGVSYEDLTRDFELTSFSVFGERYRSTPTEQNTFDSCGYYCNHDGNWMGWGKMNDFISGIYGENDKPLYVAIENYLKQACNISDETIAGVRRNLLGTDVDFSN